MRHFMQSVYSHIPNLLGISVVTMPQIIGFALDAIRFVCLEMGYYYVHYGQGGQEKI